MENVSIIELSAAAERASELAAIVGEEFVIAITAAYLAGLEKGKREAA